jgi:hypothetical protein
MFVGQIPLFKQYFCDNKLSRENIIKSKEYFDEAVEILKVKIKTSGKN